tara:strand:- start:435 stop:1304 length:870 start_codon:yes stop_codon:yes gene_type:complete
MSEVAGSPIDTDLENLRSLAADAADSSDIQVSLPYLIPLDNLEENSWNPNEQSEQTFNQLVDEIRTDGFQDPLLVVPKISGKVDPKKDKFIIIGGAHRYRVALVHSMTEVPCYIMENWDEAEQKLKTVRRNLISGELNEQKFNALVADLSEHHNFELAELPYLLGFDNKKDFDKLIKDTQIEEEDDLSWAEKEEETSKELEAVDSISDVLNNIFSNYGDTVPQSFLFFSHKGKSHFMVMMEDELYELMQVAAEGLRASKKDMNEFLLELFRRQDASASGDSELSDDVSD